MTTLVYSVWNKLVGCHSFYAVSYNFLSLLEQLVECCAMLE